jgi:L-alanine-DL-glutamate epimerase-like enolase superfamily enzyme
VPALSAVDITGGSSEGLRVATLAEAHGAAPCPHSLPELRVHLVAAAKAGAYVEYFPLAGAALAHRHRWGRVCRLATALSWRSGGGKQGSQPLGASWRAS